MANILAHETLTLSGTAQNLPSIPTKAFEAIIVLVANSVDNAGSKVCGRFTLTSSETPNTTTGMPLFHGQGIKLETRDELLNFKVIWSSEVAEAHKLEISYQGV
jgi:hypothetical protein